MLLDRGTVAALILSVSASALSIPIEPYAPVKVACPVTPLVRPATSLSGDENQYRVLRKAQADIGLKKWLAKTNAQFGTTSNLPTIGFTVSGGGYRSLLLGAGVIQGLDERDSSVSTSGLFQALTYQAGLSGGAWLLSSFAGNNYPTITYLKKNLWEASFQAGLLLPNGLLAAVAYAEVTTDIQAKQTAGFPPSLTDPWGRLLSYQLLQGYDGGVQKTLSSIASLSNFTSHAVPYPIIVALGVKENECLPGPNATTWEFHPYEMGSWDSDVSAFTRTSYLGSSLVGGIPVTCIQNYDNLGYVLGTSSNLFNELCEDVPVGSLTSTDLDTVLAGIVDITHEVTTRDEYAVYPNPFYSYNSPSSKPNPANPVYAQKELRLVDGGEALQNNPIWPMLQPPRSVDVLIVNDNSADTSNNFPNGSEILTTYVQTFNHNLSRMPFIPSVETFISQGLNKRATFFGCNATDKLTIVYLPNVNYTFAMSNEPTAKLQYLTSETDGMIANGVAMITQNGDAGWATCLGCALMMKTGNGLPSECGACFHKYCYYNS